MKLYLKFLNVHFKSALQYKTSFILSFIANIFDTLGYCFTIYCLFSKIDNIGGFNLYEVLLTFAIINFGHSFCSSFFRGIDQFDDLIISGGFDKLLIRPQNILLQICGEQISFTKMARFIFSTLILIYASIKIEINWSILKLITLLLMIISSVIVFLSIFILSAAYCFISFKGLEVRNVFTDGGKHMAQYPIGIFNKGIIYFFTFIIPLGFVNYYPLLFLIGKTNNYFVAISPLITIIYLIPSLFIFYKGVKKYSSVGS